MSKGKQGRLRLSNGAEYKAAVLLVTGRDPNGKPRECRFVHEDESVTLAGGEEFVVVYAPVKVMEAKPS
jgi:hypothetical protein